MKKDKSNGNPLRTCGDLATRGGDTWRRRLATRSLSWRSADKSRQVAAASLQHRQRFAKGLKTACIFRQFPTVHTQTFFPLRLEGCGRISFEILQLITGYCSQPLCDHKKNSVNMCLHCVAHALSTLGY